MPRILHESPLGPIEESLRKTLSTLGISKPLIDKHVASFRGPADSTAMRNFPKTASFFGHLLAQPSSKERHDQLFDETATLFSPSIRYGHDLSMGLWAISQGIRDFPDPGATIDGLSRIVDAPAAMLTVANTLTRQMEAGLITEPNAPEIAKECIEGLTDPITESILCHIYPQTYMWEGFLEFASAHPKDVKARINYEKGIRRFREVEQNSSTSHALTLVERGNELIFEPPGQKALRLQQERDMISISFHFGVGIIAVGKSGESHQGIEEAIGLKDDFSGVRDRIIPGTIIAPGSGRDYELIIPDLINERVGGGTSGFPIGMNPFKMVAWHMFDQGFPDYVTRVQGVELYRQQDLPLSVAADLRMEKMSVGGDVGIVVKDPVELPEMGFLRIRDDQVAVLSLLSSSANQQYLVEGDSFCDFSYDNTARKLVLREMYTKHKGFASNPDSVKKALTAKGGAWEDVDIEVEYRKSK